MVRAYRACRRRKRGTRNAQRYEMSLLDHLVGTAQALSGRTWRPSRAVAFVVRRPKAREILAADFADRVVHHLLVPRLERQFEPVFIHDCFSNRRGKGTHAAVNRLQQFLRQASSEGAQRVHYLQLDIANFFNSIDRRRLFGFIAVRLEKDCRRPAADARHLPEDDARQLLWLARVLLTGNAAEGAYARCEPEEFAHVPAHKRLINAPAGKGLPIGNLTSQFFANVYLNDFDQYVKHVLKCRHCVRYVDDCVLLHQDPAQLAAWRADIARFLAERLGLALRDAGRLRAASDGIDFLGYIVRRDYRLVRKRVVGHLREKLDRYRDAAERGMDRARRETLRALLASYLAHFKHASAGRLTASLWRRYPWLGDWLSLSPLGKLIACWAPRGVASLRGQWRWFCKRYPAALVLMQAGNCVECYGEHARRVAALRGHGGKAVARPGWSEGESGLAWPIAKAEGLVRRLLREGWQVVRVVEDGWLKGGLKRRGLRQVHGGKVGQITPKPVTEAA